MAGFILAIIGLIELACYAANLSCSSLIPLIISDCYFSCSGVKFWFISFVAKLFRLECFCFIFNLYFRDLTK